MGILINIGKISNNLYVCDGCCCGHEEKGNPAILHEFIEDQIKKNNLDITIHKPYCLGPCSQANVIKVVLDGKNYWFKRMNEEQDIQDLMEFMKSRTMTENLEHKQMQM
ncbi:MAG TPA: (2Fe-2S) ferredoxin domain-containing protein [Candidatus Nanoarchaeia archaeon]|nr:(2Fe-2S) ferredoxin domain-containing protein [Candidatus Nanoarchaeia archaeon]